MCFYLHLKNKCTTWKGGKKTNQLGRTQKLWKVIKELIKLGSFAITFSSPRFVKYGHESLKQVRDPLVQPAACNNVNETPIQTTMGFYSSKLSIPLLYIHHELAKRK
jgi:hypothetical protein